MGRDIAVQSDALTDEELWVAVYRDLHADLFWPLAERYRGPIEVFGRKMAGLGACAEDPERVAADFYHWCLADELAKRWRSFDPTRGYRLKTYTAYIIPSLWAEYFRREIQWAAQLIVRGAPVDIDGIPVAPDGDSHVISADIVVDIHRAILADRKFSTCLKGREAYIIEALRLPVWRAFGESAATFIRARLGRDPVGEAETILALARAGGETAIRDWLCKTLDLTHGALYTAHHRALARWTQARRGRKSRSKPTVS